MFFTHPALLLCLALVLLDRPDDFFNHPETLCRALEGKGVRTGAWAPLSRDQKGQPQMHTPYTCEYPVPGGAADAANSMVPLGLLKITPPNLIFRVSATMSGRPIASRSR